VLPYWAICRDFGYLEGCKRDKNLGKATSRNLGYLDEIFGDFWATVPILGYFGYFFLNRPIEHLEKANIGGIKVCAFLGLKARSPTSLLDLFRPFCLFLY